MITSLIALDLKGLIFHCHISVDVVHGGVECKTEQVVKGVDLEEAARR